MGDEVSNLLGLEAGDPWDHPSFLSTIDALCNNRGFNGATNARRDVLTPLHSPLPSSFSSKLSPKSFPGFPCGRKEASGSLGNFSKAAGSDTLPPLESTSLFTKLECSISEERFFSRKK
jgi:hypothetical protein